MKNFLIVVPQYVTKGEYYNFPLGLGYIFSYLKRAGFNVFCLNLCHFENNIPLESILREQIEKNKINVLCTGTLSYYWDKVDFLLKTAKKIKPGIVNVVGGAIVISDPEIALRNLAIDIGVIGEGEETMAELAEALCQNRNYENIKGLAYLKDGKVKITSARPYIENLDSLPFPDYNALGYDEWIKLIFNSGNFEILDDYENLRYTEILASRSCPFACTFCYHHLGKKYRQRSLDNVFTEIDFWNGNPVDIDFPFGYGFYPSGWILCQYSGSVPKIKDKQAVLF